MAKTPMKQTPPKAQTGVLRIVSDVKAQILEWWRAIPPPWRRRLQQGLLGLSLLMSVIIIVTGIGIYILGWQNNWALAVSRWVPYPAAIVNQEIGSYRDYAVHANSIKGQATTALPAKQVAQQAMGRLINSAFLNAYAQSRRIGVSRAEVQAELRRIYASQGGEKEARRILRQNYHISGSDYARLVSQQLLRHKAEQALARDEQLKSAARQKAIDILKQIQRGEDFARLARNHSQHSSSLAEGEAQIVSSDVLPTEVAAKAAELKEGQTSGVIEGRQGYYLVKRELGDGMRLRVIEIRNFNPGEWLSRQYDKAFIIKLLYPAR